MLLSVECGRFCVNICAYVCLFLARILRLLATMHIFQEVSPNVFAHNRISSVLDTGKSVEEVIKECFTVSRMAKASY
jgi:hypothetical protein